MAQLQKVWKVVCRQKNNKTLKSCCVPGVFSNTYKVGKWSKDPLGILVFSNKKRAIWFSEDCNMWTGKPEVYECWGYVNNTLKHSLTFVDEIPNCKTKPKSFKELLELCKNLNWDCNVPTGTLFCSSIKLIRKVA